MNPPEQRNHQYLEAGCGTSTEAIYLGRHQNQGQVPELRPGDDGLSERVSYVHVLRVLEMRLILCRQTIKYTKRQTRSGLLARTLLLASTKGYIEMNQAPV